MVTSSCTVFFDGRFWIALAERQDQSGAASAARHVFGPEPSNPELLHFYLFILPTLRFLPGMPLIKPEKRKRPRAGSRPRKSLNAYKELRSADAGERARKNARTHAAEARILYGRKAASRKLKKKGK